LARYCTTPISPRITIDGEDVHFETTFWTDAMVTYAVATFARNGSRGSSMTLPSLLSARQRQMAHSAAQATGNVTSKSFGQGADRHLVLTRSHAA
jgi:predicted RNA-binding protein Jag